MTTLQPRIQHALAIAVVIGMTVTAFAQKPPAKDPLPALQGEWVIDSVNGQTLADAGVVMTLTFKGNQYTQTTNGTVDERGTFKIDVSKKPIEIELVIAEGKDAGKTQPGILEITGGTLRGHLSLPGGSTRPTDFTAKEAGVLFVAKKRTK